MLVHFTETTETVRRIELDGRSGVRRTGTGDRPDMSADRINLDFVPESGLLAHARLDGSSVLTLRERGEVTRVTGTTMDLFVGADGQTLTRLDVTAPTEVWLPRDGETPARTIRSAGLLAEGAEPKGLDRAVFSGGVTYQEDRPASAGQAAATRFAKSNSLVLGLGGALNQVSTATFRQGFSVTDGTMTATADEGRYDAKAETLQLRGNDPKRTVRMVDQQVDVKALEIDVDLKQDAFDARSSVVSVLTPSARPLAKDATPTGLFERGKSITGHADTLNYSSVTSIASYSGSVVLFQEGDAGKEGTVIRAAKVRLDEQKQNLDAEGQVQTEFYIEQAPGASGPQGTGVTTIGSDRLSYKEATRRAEYAGAVTMVSGPEQKLGHIRNRLHQLGGDALGGAGRAVRKQQGKLIATDSRREILPAA
jgi:lipopolysaccharide export system protein LptA